MRLARLSAALLLVAAWACRESQSVAPPPPPRDSGTVWVQIADELFELELAADPGSRYRGLSGRGSIPRNGGMLFAFPASRAMTFVMRDCAIPIDLAFLDGSGRILAVHAMQPEPPRRPGESASAYELRLRPYSSGAPARFAIETAGGRLAQLGVVPGQRAVFDTEGLARQAR